MQTYHRLDDVHMSEIDREHAKAHMRSAELVLDLLSCLLAKTRSVSAALGRRVVDLAQRIHNSFNRRSSTAVTSGGLEQSLRDDLVVGGDLLPLRQVLLDDVGKRSRARSTSASGQLVEALEPATSPC